MAALRVLIIDDSEDDREAIRRMLTRGGSGNYEVIEADTGEEGIRLFREQQPACTLLDYSLPGRNGVAILEELRRIHPYAAAVMLTGQGNETIAVDVMKAGAQDYLTKDTLSRDTLARAIAHAIGQQELAGKLEQQRQLAEQKQKQQEQEQLLAEKQKQQEELQRKLEEQQKQQQELQQKLEQLQKQQKEQELEEFI